MSPVDDFIQYLVAVKNLSIATANSYSNDLNVFSKYLKGRDLLGVNQNEISNFLADQTDKGFTSNTVDRRLSTLKHFYSFLAKEDRIANSPCQRFPKRRIEQKIPRILSHKDVDALLAFAPKVGKNPAERAKNRVIIELLYGSGLRVSELASLKRDIFQGSPQAIIVKGKGSKERIVVISKKATNAIKKYFEISPSNSAFLFPSRSKQGYLNRELIFLRLKEIAHVAGVDPSNVSPHKLRHAFASHLLENGANLVVIQKLLGHANITTTEIYTHVLDKNLINTVNEKHPFGKKGKV